MSIIGLLIDVTVTLDRLHIPVHVSVAPVFSKHDPPDSQD